eukprot:6916479-Pyramimonas_sp.AAC.1
MGPSRAAGSGPSPCASPSPSGTMSCASARETDVLRRASLDLPFCSLILAISERLVDRQLDVGRLVDVNS